MTSTDGQAPMERAARTNGRPRANAGGPERIVMLRALNLGDLLVAVPALRAVRRRWPEHRTVLATHAWLAPVVALADAVDELLPTNGLAPLPRAATGAWLAVNLHGNGPRSNAVLDELRPAARIGHRGHGWDGPAWVPGMHERQRWCRLLAAHGVPADPADFCLRSPQVPSPLAGAVVIHPGAGFGSRRWPAARFAAVAATLARQGHRVVVTGSHAERELAAEVVRRAWLPPAALLAGRISLVQLAALVADARLVICPDTGVAHLSYAYRTPSVVLFGPAPVQGWGPPAGGPHLALGDDDLRRGEPFAADPDPAMLAVDPADVLEAAQRLLARTAAYRA